MKKEYLIMKKNRYKYFISIDLRIAIYTCLLIVISCNLILLSGCTSKKIISIPKQMELPEIGDEIAIIHTNLGDIKLKLLTEVAPKTVEAFKKTITDQYFDDSEMIKSIDTNVIFTTNTLNLDYYEEVFGDEYLFETNTEYRHYPGAMGFLKYLKQGPATEFYITASVELEKEYLESLKELDELYPSVVVDNYSHFGGEPRGDMTYTVFAQVYEGMEIVNEIYATSYDPITYEVDQQYFIESIELTLYK